MAYIGNSPGVASQRVSTTFTATAGQTTFTPVSGYTLGYCDVYQNGVKLISGDDYTAADGVSVVLGTGAAAGDAVEVVAMFPRGLSDGYTKAEADARYDATGAASTAQSAAQTYAAGLVDDLSGVTNAATARANLGLGNVENKSSATIRGEITSGNVTGALGYTPVNKAGDTMTGLLEMRKSGSANDTGVAATLRKADGTGGLRVFPSLGGGQMNGRVVEGDCGVISGEQFGSITIGSHDGASIRISQGALQLNGRNSAAQADLGIDSAGRVTMPNQPSFLAGGDIGWQTVTAGNPVGFNVINGTHNFNSGGGYNNTTYRFTAPVSGVYQFNASLYTGWSGTSSSFYWTKNGGYVYAGNDAIVYFQQGGEQSMIQPNLLIYLSAGDWVDIRSRNTQTSYVYLPHSSLSGFLVG